MVSTIRHRQRWHHTFRFWLVAMLLLLSLTPAQLAMAGSYNPTVTSDGLLGSNEWQASELVATESADNTYTATTPTAAINAGLGYTSNLDQLWLTWDSNNLYLRIDGVFSTAEDRGFVAFLDVNYGGTTIANGPSSVGSLNHANYVTGTLNSLITAPDFSDTVTPFRADYAVGSMKGVGIAASDPPNDYAGLRSWGADGGNPGSTTDFSSITGIALTLGNLTTISGTNVYTVAEATLPWSVLYATGPLNLQSGMVISGATLGIVVVQANVSSSTGVTRSYETLPSNGIGTAGSHTLSKVYTATIDANGDSYPDVGVQTGQAVLSSNTQATATRPNNASTHTSAKTLNGLLDDWHVNEFIGAGTDSTASNSLMRYHVTWDANNVYVAFAGLGNGLSAASAGHFNVAIDTDVVCSDDDNMAEIEGVSFNNSAEPDFLYRWRTDGTTPMFDRYVANGTNWDFSSTTGGGVSSNSNPAIVEMSIPRSELNNLPNGAAFYLWASDSSSADYDAYGNTPDAVGSNRLSQFAYWNSMNAGVNVKSSKQGSDICITYADVSIHKSVTPSGALLPGQPVTYTLTYTNTGPDTAADVEINDLLPEQVTVDSISASGPAVTLLSNYQWSVADIPASNSGSITLVGTVTSTLNTATTIFNTATITASNDTDDSNNSATASSDIAIPTLTLEQASYSQEENGELLNAIVTLSPANPYASVFVNYELQDDTATYGDDYADERPGDLGPTLLFPTGTTTQSIPLRINDDTTDEVNETFTVVLVNPTGAMLGDPHSANVTILDNDEPPTPSVTIGDLSINENGGTLNIPVSIDVVGQGDITITVATSSNSAVAPADYASSVLTGVISLGNMSTVLTGVPIVDDNIDEEDEIFFVEIITATNVLIGDDTAAITITDNDITPTLSINTPAASEALGMITFTVSLNRPSSRSITGLATTTSSIATSPADFTALVNAPFTIPAGSTSTTIPVVVNNDTLYENNENFVLDVSNVVNATVPDGRVSGVINNDDVQPTLTIADVSANEDSGAMGFTVSLNTPSGINTSGTFSTSSGTANAPTDYSTLTGLVFLIPAGSTSTLVTVTLVADDIDETDETLQGHVSGVSAASVADNVAIGTIADDDLPPAVSVSDVTLSEATSSMVFTISLAGASIQNVTGSLGTSDGTAVAGQDYQALTSSFTIPAGSRSTSVAVTINNDALDENNETFALNLSNISNGTLSDGSGTGTINDDDLPPTLQVTPLVSGSEGEVRTFSITLSSPSGLIVSGQAALVDGSAQFSSDYSWREPVGGTALPQSSSFSLAAGETNKSFEVVMVDDAIFEGNETFSIEVSNVQNATVGSSTSSGTVVENDSAPGLSIADGRAYETDGNMVFTITLNMVSAVAVQGVLNTSNYSAIGGDDYTALVNTPFTIQPGSTSVTVNVAMLNDFALEAIETFTVTLGSIQNAIALDGAAIGTITDDDSTGTGTLGVTLDVTPDSTQNFKFFRSFGSLFYMDDEPGGLQRDTYTNSISYTLSPGRYIITPSIPTGWFLSGINCMPANAAIVNNVAVSITLPGGGQSVGCTYGIVRAVTINTRAYYDANRSGTYNSLEAAVPTVTMKVYITPSLTSTYSGVTNKYGKYNFSYIRPQPYTVCATDWPAPYTGATQPIPYNALYGKPCYTINLLPGTAANLYYGFSPAAIAADEPTDALFFPIGSIQSGVVISTLPDVVDDNAGYEEQAPVDTDVDLPIEETDLKPEDIEVVTVRKVFLPVINR